jgi:hypothetical protein
VVRRADESEQETKSRDWHDEKHEAPSISSDFGRSIRLKFDDSNADSSIRCNRELDSNVISSSDLYE